MSNSGFSLAIDADIGDDIDDALALAMLLGSPEVDVWWVTTVFRDAPLRARLAEMLLRAYGQRKSAATGASKPLLQPWSAIANGRELGQTFKALTIPEPEREPLPAMDVMSHALLSSHEEQPLTLLCIGPLTNIALMLGAYPDFISRVRIVLMGGALATRYRNRDCDWNFSCDPEAAQIVLDSGADVRVVPLDVTTQCGLSRAQTEELLRTLRNGSDGARLLARMLDVWREETGRDPVLHDPLAALATFLDVVTWQPMNLRVELCGQARGQTRVEDGAPNVQVATQVDVQRAIDEFLQRVVRL